MAKRLGKILFFVLVGIGLLAAAALVWATSESGAATISDALREELRDKAGLEVTFSNIDIEILPPRLRIRDVTAEDEKGRVRCTLEEAEFAPDALDLLGGELTIEEVYLGSPECRVKLTRADIDALEEALRGDPDAGRETGLDISKLPPFEVFAVSEGRLEALIDDPGRVGTVNLSIAGLGLDVTGGRSGIEVRGLIGAAGGDWSRDDQVVRETLSDLSFRAAVAADAIDVRHLSAALAGAQVRLRDAHVPLPLWPRGPDVADLSIEVPLDLFNRLPLGLPQLAGSASFLGQASARKDATGKVGLSARGRATLDDTQVDDFVIGDLEGLFSLSPRGVAFAEVELATAEGRLTLDGNIAFDDQLSADVTARLDRIELAQLLENVTFDGAQVTQRMSGTVHAKGRLKPLDLDGTVKLEVRDHTVLDAGFRSRGAQTLLYIPRASVGGRFRVTDRFFAAPDLEVRLPRTRVAVDMTFNFDTRRGWKLLAQSRDLYLDDLVRIAGFDVSGHGAVTCRISDPAYGDPQIVGSGSFAGFSFAGFDFGQVSTGVRFRGGELVFDGLGVKGARSRYTAQEVRLDFGAPGGLAIETKIDAEQLDLQELARTFHLDTRPYGSPSGLLFGRIAIDYRQRPEHFRVEADLAHGGLTVFDEKFGPDVAKLTWNDGQLTVAELGLTKGRGTISITGAMLPDHSLNFIAIAAGIDLAAIDRPEVRRLGITATGQLFAAIEGTLEHPRGWADLRIGEAEHRGVRYGPTHVELALDGSKITGFGKLGGDQLRLEHGVIDLSNDRFEVELFATDIDLIHTLGLKLGNQRASLVLTGELALRGRLDQRPELTGWAELERVELAINNFVFKNKNAVELTARRDRLRLRRTRFAGPHLTFDLKGGADLDRVEAQISGLGALAALADLIGPIRSSSGTLTFDARVKGRWTDPSFRGSATVADGALSIKGLPYPIEGIGGRIELGAKVIRFADFTGRSAGGTLGADGKVTLAGLKIADYLFRLRFDGLELQPLEDLSFHASTTGDGLLLRPDVVRDLKEITGGATLPTFTGDVEVANLRFTQDFRAVQVSDLTVDRLAGDRFRMSKPRLFDASKNSVAFDIRLHGSRRLRVRNNLVDAELRIDDTENPLRLLGTNQVFGFKGRVLGTKGQVRFAGKRFDLRYAAVTFRDPARPENPDFRVTADGQLRDWKVTITAKGNVDEYEIHLSSQPFLSQEDLVFLLLTGMTRAEHRQFGGQGLAGSITPLLEQMGPGGQLVPEDVELQIYTEYSERAGTDTTRVSLGKRLTKDIWVSLSSSVGQERDIKANLEYKINDKWSLSADFENDNESQVGNVGLDLKFRLEF